VRSELRLREKSGRLPEDLVRAPQLAILPLQLLQTLGLRAGQRGPAPRVALDLAQPLPKGLRGAPDLPRDRPDRRPLRLMLRLVLHDHANRPLPHLR